MSSPTSKTSASEPITVAIEPSPFVPTDSSTGSGNFNRKRDKSTNQVGSKTLGIVVESDDHEELDWGKRLRKRFRSRDASGYGFSLALHLMFLILLSLLVLTGNRPVEEISTQVSEADPAELEFGEAASFVLDDLMEFPESPPELTRLPGVFPR